MERGEAGILLVLIAPRATYLAYSRWTEKRKKGKKRKKEKRKGKRVTEPLPCMGARVAKQPVHLKAARK